ncbi:MAG: hypothetical protein R3281_15950, partial [Balneolaceae bacterium]|nr:hypothetical protein [Balneolaceae bacterium]
DGTEAGQRGLELALKLAQINGNQLLILGVSNRSHSVKNRSREIEEMVQKANISARLHLIDRNILLHTTRLLNQVRGSLLIIPKNQPLLKEEWAGKMFKMAKCPLLLMN